jgi:hypothetical protein
LNQFDGFVVITCLQNCNVNCNSFLILATLCSTVLCTFSWMWGRYFGTVNFPHWNYICRIFVFLAVSTLAQEIQSWTQYWLDQNRAEEATYLGVYCACKVRGNWMLWWYYCVFLLPLLQLIKSNFMPNGPVDLTIRDDW